MARLNQAFESLFTINMGVRPGERIVVFSDTIRPDEIPDTTDTDRRNRLLATARETSAYATAVFGNASFVHFPATIASGAEPPALLWQEVFGREVVDELAQGGLFDRLLAKATTPADIELADRIIRSRESGVAKVIVAMANNSTSHTRFRHLVNRAGGRFASLPHFDPDMFFTSMAVNWQALSKRTSMLAETVNRAEHLLISTQNGSRLSISKKGRTAKGDDGILTEPGSFGNLPAGEVYLAPLEGTAEGELVIEFAPTHKLHTPLKLTVRGGEVTCIAGEDPHRIWLEQKFSESSKNRNIAELGIGTNDRATRPDNILEAEKILGTIHLALGDNSGFGGNVSTPFHEDYVFYLPTLTAILPDGSNETILDNGNLRGCSL